MQQYSLNDITIIFLHIRKTGGVTFRLLFKGVLPEHAYFKVPGKLSHQHIKKLSSTERSRLQFIHINTPCDVHKYIPHKSGYVTLLRNPVERIISLHKHLERRGEPVDIRELAHLEANNQVHMLGSNVQEAKRNLDNFLIVGLTEKFDHCIVLLRKKLGLSNMFYAQRSNVGRYRKDSVSDADRAYIRAVNTDEFELYQYAQKLLDNEIRAYGVFFWFDLMVYKLINRTKGLTQTIRHIMKTPAIF